MPATATSSSWIEPVARTGLTAKGVVYCLVGILAFMAAFHIGGQSSSDADKEGALQFIEQTGGKLLLGLIALGLFSYSGWRFIEAFRTDGKRGEKAKEWGNRIRYFFSALVYLSIAVFAAKMVLFNDNGSGGSSSQRLVRELLNKPLGQWLVGIVALFTAGVGIYQIWYGLSEKYKKHVSQAHVSSDATAVLVRSGKIGYTARGIVWLIIAWLIIQAAWEANSAKAGDTSSAFRFLEDASYGSYLLGALGVGLVCYGIFNFVRARYEVIN